MLTFAGWFAGSAFAPAQPGPNWPRLEASFVVTNSIADAFDFQVCDLRAQIAQPDGSAVSLPAFNDGGTLWRVRHLPRAAGAYRITGLTLNGAALAVTSLQPTNWFVSGPPTGDGFVRVDPANPQRFASGDGRRFFPVGANVAWNASLSNDYPRMFSRMAAARENWARVWMDHFNESKNLDWPKPGAFGQLSLTVARRWDHVLASAEQAGIHLQMVFQHHGQYASTNGSNVNPNWEQNPYHTLNGGFLTNATQFFTDPTAKALTKRKLRYAVARWGAFPSVMAWELWNEVQFTDAASANQWTNIASWHAEMAAFLRAQDPYGHLITTSSELAKPIWDAMDYYQYHNYSSDMVTSSRDAEEPSPLWPVKPNFAGECAMPTPARLWVHPPPWASLMAAQAGAACPWWWDTIDPENLYADFRGVSDFVSRSGLAGQDGLAKSQPRLTASLNGPLSFAPGGGWSTASQHSFTVGQGAPAGISAAPSFLQGVWHKEMTPLGYTFSANYIVPGTFSVQVLETSTHGDANLRLFLDGAVKTNINFPKASAGPTNLTITIPVTAGAHSILLTNAAQDWIGLGNVTLDPYVPQLGGYAVGNPHFSAAWIWHRTNLYSATPGLSVAGTVDVGGLNPGSYSAAWWDTAASVLITNFTLNVTDTNAVTVTTPPVTRSAALFVGKPAQAALESPVLSLMMGSNSPAAMLPLALTNAGGLPLIYSLSVTGLSTVAYSATTTTNQPFAWRDVSATGREVTTHFTALAGPKTAKDEGIAGPFPIGFAFPFFSGGQSPDTFTQVFVSPNGFISFSPFAGDSSVNTTLPLGNAPSNLVALVWDDLDLSSTGRVFVASDPLAGEFAVQWQDGKFKSGSAAYVTAQIVLRSTGEILLQYRTLGRTNSCTAGVQNAARNRGLQVTFNSAADLKGSSTIRLTPNSWLAASPAGGVVPGGRSESIGVALNSLGCSNGLYEASLQVQTSDAAQPGWSLPVQLVVTNTLPAAPSLLGIAAVTWSNVTLLWTDNAVNESGFEVQRRLGAGGKFAGVGFASGGARGFSDETVDARTTYFYRVRATNSAGASPWSDETGVLTPWSPMDTWRQSWFGSPENTGPAADAANPDGDRLPNFVEYAFGLSPLVSNAVPWAITFTNQALTASFRRPRPAPVGVRCVVEVTSKVADGPWQSGAGFTAENAVDQGNGTESVTVRDLTLAPGVAARYLRLRVLK